MPVQRDSLAEKERERGGCHTGREGMMELQESKREKEKERESKEEMREGRGGLRKAKLPPSAYVDRLLSCSILAVIQSKAKMSLSLSFSLTADFQSTAMLL